MATQLTPPQDQPTVYFWRENDPQTGWLSQWYYCPFRDDQDQDKVYKTAEQYDERLFTLFLFYVSVLVIVVFTRRLTLTPLSPSPPY